MMLRGTASLELSFVVDDEVLSEIGVENHSRTKLGGIGACLSRQERDAIWCALPEWLQEKLLDEAAGNAEPETDDADWPDDHDNNPAHLGGGR